MKFEISIVILTMAQLSLKWAAAVPQWHNATDGSRYLIESELKYNWFHAWNECAGQNLRMLIIDTKAKNDLIVELLQKDYGVPLYLWIAGHDNMSNDFDNRAFYWLPTGQQMSFTYWRPGQPGTLTQNCIGIDMVSAIYEWNDYYCTSLWGYACEENHLPAKYNADFSQKTEQIELNSANLIQENRQQQQKIHMINTKTDFEIDQILFYLKKDIEKLQNDANQKIEETNQQRRQKIQNLVEIFSKKLQANHENVNEILT